MQSNYETTKKKAQQEFLLYDQEKMIKKFGLDSDETYLYIRFVGRLFRIHRKTGLAQWSEDGFRSCTEADYEEAMTIYDVLCQSSENCHPSGRFCKLNSVKGPMRASAPGTELFRKNRSLWRNHHVRSE